MKLKRTILSEKELNLIENLISKYGSIVTFDQITSILRNEMNHQVIKNLINKLSGNGWLVRIKRGTYAVSSLESRGFLSLPVYKIAQVIEEDSYVSFEAALQYRGMFDQLLKTVTSVSQKRHAKKTIQQTAYKFTTFKKPLFFGWSQEKAESYNVKIAHAEKAILDMLYRNKDEYVIETVVNVIKNDKDKLDFARMSDYSSKFDITTQKVIGFLMDKFEVSTEDIFKRIGHRRDKSHMTTNSGIFNAKWRLYYSKRIESIGNE